MKQEGGECDEAEKLSCKAIFVSNSFGYGNIYNISEVSENSKVTSNYNAIKDVWMESYGGAIFEALYKKGTYGSQTNYKNGGELKQEGCRYLVDTTNKTFYGCVRYYYDNSSASTGGKIRFFDENKNVIDK